MVRVCSFVNPKVQLGDCPSEEMLIARLDKDESEAKEEGMVPLREFCPICKTNNLERFPMATGSDPVKEFCWR